MSYTLEEIKELILHRLDPDDLVDILNISSEDILNKFEGRLIDNLNKFDFIEDDTFNQFEGRE